MSAVFKKRALAEYGGVTQVMDPPRKRSKTFEKDCTGIDYFYLLEKCKSSNEALKILLNVSELKNFNSEDLPIALKLLNNNFNRQREPAVRVKIFSVLRILGQKYGADLELIIDIIIKLLASETSHKVIAEGLLTILTLMDDFQASNLLTVKIVMAAKSFLKDTHHYVKRQSMKLLAKIDGNNHEALNLISSFIFNNDARVRCTALEIIDMLHRNGNKMNVSFYSDVCKNLDDDFEIVRVATLHVISRIANTYPENNSHFIEKNKRLIDDAFIKVCNAVNDSSKTVKNEAVILLGTMVMVSEKILNQTLDKKLMSNMRRKESFHVMDRNLLASGEWSCGKRWGGNTSKGSLSKDEVGIISNGACGALVHGLEDETMEVRCSSINTIRLLATAHQKFASLCVDFVVEMLSDEIEAVRIEAVECLICLAHAIVVREYQLETILGALQDSSVNVREKLHKMLVSCSFSSKEGLQICIERLLENLKKYPQDEESTWMCAKQLGESHSDMVHPIIPRLLGIHYFFDTSEPDVEDPCYITLLILVFNAAEKCPPIISLFDEYTIKHYSYLRLKVPHLVPNLTFTESLEFVEMKLAAKDPCFVWKFFENLSIDPERMASTILPQINILSKIDSFPTCPIQFFGDLISCQLFLRKILKNKMWYSCGTGKTNTTFCCALKNDITVLVSMSLKLQYLFSGIDKEELDALKQIQLMSLMLYLFFILKMEKACTSSLMDKMNQLRLLFVSNEFFSKVYDTINELGEKSLAQYLLSFLSNTPMTLPPKLNSKITKCHGNLKVPVTSPDAPLIFSASLVLSVSLDAYLFNLQDPGSLRIKLCYPNNETQFSTPAENDLQLVNPKGPFRLSSKALLFSHSPWSEACYVEISLCIELPETDASVLKKCGLSPYLNICEPCKLYTCPKPITKSILSSI